MIQILYGTGNNYLADPVHGVYLGKGDHEERARALASLTPGAHVGPQQLKGIAKPGLDTLCYWGHGNSLKFCDMEAAEFVEHVRDWKKANPGLKTVEIITCNARHAAQDDSYTSQVKTLLHKKNVRVQLKAMPMGMGAHGRHTWSILKAHTPSRTWFYVTASGAKDTDEMWPAVHLVEQNAATLGNNVALAARNIERSHPMRRFGLNYGSFGTLRATLTRIA